MEPTEPQPSSLYDVWDVVQFCVCEAYALRSFMEYLRSWPDPPETKRTRLQNWKSEVGLQLGNPEVAKFGEQLLQKLRVAPPEARIAILRSALGIAHSEYFGQSAK